MTWQTLIDSLPQIIYGTWLTIALLFCAIISGLLLALALTFFLQKKSSRITIAIIDSYLFLFRGTPMLVQIFIIYYGVGQIDWLHKSFLWQAFKHPFFCAVLAMALNTAAYTTTLLIGAIKALPAGEIEAADAFALKPFARYRLIILPRLLTTLLPAYSNEVIIVLKSTSLASAITLTELTGVTQSIMAKTYITVPFLVIAGIIYLTLNMIIHHGLQRIHNVYLKRLQQ